MICKNFDIKELLPAYVSKELDRDTSNRVESHVASCSDCREELSLLTMMSEEAVPDPGEAFWAQLPGRIEREVRDRKASRKFGLSGLFDRMVLPRWAWTAAAVGALVLVTWFAVDPLKHRGEDPALHEVYDAGYASLHDPVLTHPSTNMNDLSDPQLATIDSWAGQELKTIAVEAEAVLPTADKDEYDELAELNGQEIEKLSTMLNDYYEEG